MNNNYLYNSTTLKQIKINDDSILIFDLNKQKNTNVFINTTIYQSQFGCPISFSRVEKLNSTNDNYYGLGGQFDFIYKLALSESNIIVTHPTGDVETFVEDLQELNEVEEIIYNNEIEQIDKYYYSDATDAYIIKTKNGENIKGYYYVNGSFVSRYDSTLGNPIAFSRNGLSSKHFIDIEYLGSRVRKLTNRLPDEEYCDFNYVNTRLWSIYVYKKIGDTNKKINTITFSYNSSGRLMQIKERLNDISENVRYTIYNYDQEESQLEVVNNIKGDSTIINFENGVVKSITHKENVLNLTYNDDCQTTLSINDKFQEYHFDDNNNLSFIINEQGTIQTTTYEIKNNKRLLTAKGQLSFDFIDNDKDFLTQQSASVISDNSSHAYIESNNTFYYPTNAMVAEFQHLLPNKSNVILEFPITGGRFDVVNFMIWHKTRDTNTNVKNSCKVNINFYDSNNVLVSKIIYTKDVILNTMISNKWRLATLAAQSSSNFNKVRLEFESTQANQIVDMVIGGFKKSCINVIDYDTNNKPRKVLGGNEIATMLYNKKGQLLSSNFCFFNYDDNKILSKTFTSGGLLQEITRDEYSNVISQKTTDVVSKKYYEEETTYKNYDLVSTQKDANEKTRTILYDEFNRPAINLSSTDHTAFGYSYDLNENYGLINRVSHFANNNLLSSTTLEYIKQNIKSISQFNANNNLEYVYNYEYDDNNRLKKVSIGSNTLIEYTYNYQTIEKEVVCKIVEDEIKYVYDTFDRLKEVYFNNVKKYAYIYEDANVSCFGSTKISSIKNVTTDEDIKFKYENNKLNEFDYNNYKEKYSFNENNTIHIISKYDGENLLSKEKILDSSSVAKKDNIIKFENDLLTKSEDDMYVTMFSESSLLKKNKNESDVDVYRNLRNHKNEIFTPPLSTSIPNVIRGNDGLPYVKSTASTTPHYYSFANNSIGSDFTELSYDYSVFFGFNTNENITLLKLDNQIGGDAEVILFNLQNDKLIIRAYNANTGIQLSENEMTLTNGLNNLNFITFNVTVEQVEDNKYSHTFNINVNGEYIGTCVVELTRKICSMELASTSSQTIDCRLYSLIVKTKSWLDNNTAYEYSRRLKEIQNTKVLEKINYNKKIRLLNPNLPIIYLDSNLSLSDGTIKPKLFSANENTVSFSDNFTYDSLEENNVYVMRNQTLEYKITSCNSSTIGVRFKPIDGETADIISLHSQYAKLKLFVDIDGTLKLKVNGIIYILDSSMDQSWTNYFIRWTKVSQNESIGSCVYNFYIYKNNSLLSTKNVSTFNAISNMIVSFGKEYGTTIVDNKCVGFMSKLLIADTSIAAATLNNAFNFEGEFADNEYNRLSLKLNHRVYTNNQRLIKTKYSYDNNNDKQYTKLKKEETYINNVLSLSNQYSYGNDNIITGYQSQTNYGAQENSTLSLQNYLFTYDAKKQIKYYNDGKDVYYYEYDENGNVLNVYKTGSLIHTATYSSDNLINTVNGYIISYDSGGYPLIKKQGSIEIEKYAWECGKLKSVELVQQHRKFVFEYDCNGLRTSKKEYHSSSLYDTTYYYYNVEGLLAYETRSRNNIKLEYEYDAEGTLYAIYYNGTPYYYIKDALGNINYLTDANGNYVARINYSGAFGSHSVESVGSSSALHIASINPFRYKGYYYDVETQLYWVSSRYYSPELCRWISPDSIEYLDPESINGLNLYCYCMNNPIMYADPSGCFPVLACILGLTALVGMGLTIGGVASDNNLMTAIGLTMVAIPALISGGMALYCAGAVGTMAIGGITAVAGLGTGLFASAEYQEAFTGNNWMLDAGMSEEWYNGLMLATAAIATAGTVASMAGVTRYQKFGNSNWHGGWRKMRSHYLKHGRPEMGYRSVFDYTNGANAIVNNGGVYLSNVNSYAQWIAGNKYLYVGVGRGSNLITTYSIRTIKYVKYLSML